MIIDDHHGKHFDHQYDQRSKSMIMKTPFVTRFRRFSNRRTTQNQPRRIWGAKRVKALLDWQWRECLEGDGWR
jgi:hypothetical protein